MAQSTDASNADWPATAATAPPLVRAWWILALRGVLGVLFGLGALVWPSITLGMFVLGFGTYVLVDGLAAVVQAVRAAERPLQGAPLFLEGVVSVGLGLLAWGWPFALPPVLLYLIASWGIFTGLLELLAALLLLREPTTRWLFGLAGVSSILLGMVLMLVPQAGAVEIVRMVGVYAVTFGILTLGAALRLRQPGRWDAPATSGRDSLEGQRRRVA